MPCTSSVPANRVPSFSWNVYSPGPVTKKESVFEGHADQTVEPTRCKTLQRELHLEGSWRFWFGDLGKGWKRGVSQTFPTAVASRSLHQQVCEWSHSSQILKHLYNAQGSNGILGASCLKTFRKTRGDIFSKSFWQHQRERTEALSHRCGIYLHWASWLFTSLSLLPSAGCAANLCNVHKPDAAQSQDRQGGLALGAWGLPCYVLGLAAFSSEGLIHVCGNHSHSCYFCGKIWKSSPWAVAGCDAKESINGHGLLHEQRPSQKTWKWCIGSYIGSFRFWALDIIRLGQPPGFARRHGRTLVHQPPPICQFCHAVTFSRTQLTFRRRSDRWEGTERQKGSRAWWREIERERELERKRQLRQLLDAFGL